MITIVCLSINGVLDLDISDYYFRLNIRNYYLSLSIG